jgi:creatinine amidohydrolase
MLLHHRTWPEVEDYLRQCQGILVPIGSTEQHGPSGLIGTDAIAAEVIAAEAGRLAEALVAPTIAVGMAEHHMAFTGSMTLRPETMTALLEDYAASLHRHGFRHLYFVNGHGGNVRILSTVLKKIDELADAPRCKFVNWWVVPRAKAIRAELYGEAEGMHATPSEISVTWHAHPDQIRGCTHGGVAPRMRRWQSAEHYRELYPDGRIGSDPSLATAEAGARLIEAAGADIAEDFIKFLGG